MIRLAAPYTKALALYPIRFTSFPPTVIVILTRLSAIGTYAQWSDPLQTLSSRKMLERTVAKKPLISIVDDDESVREGTVDLIRSVGFAVLAFEGADDFLNSGCIDSTACLIADVRMPGNDRA